MSQEPINVENSLEERLVAYLDGELDNDSCRRIEELLAVDPEVRRKLNWLEQTWEILDELGATPVGEDFTRTTLEMVAVAAEKDVHKIREEAPRRRRRLWFLAVSVLIISCVSGFAAVTLTTTDPNQELLQNLPLLENLDEYRQIKDIQFLRMLQKEKLFVTEGEPASSVPVAARSDEISLESVNNLTPSQKYELKRKQEHFDGLDLAEKKRLRQLYQQIQEDDQSAALKGIMTRYYRWYKPLPQYNKSELSELPIEKQIAWIKNFLQEEQTKISSKPPIADADKLWTWMQEYESREETALIDRLPEWVRENLKNMPSSARREALMWMMWQRTPGGPNKSVQLSDSDLVDLFSKLSPQTRKLLESKSQAEQTRIIQSWAHNLLRQKRRPGQGGMVSDDLLAEFFEKDLNSEQRDRLMSMSGEDMQHELLRMYIDQTKPPERPPRRPDEFRRGPPPGEGMGPPGRPLERPEDPENHQ